jgi:hypothetical protein
MGGWCRIRICGRDRICGQRPATIAGGAGYNEGNVFDDLRSRYSARPLDMVEDHLSP